MDSVLGRFRNLSSILKTKYSGRWPRQHFRQVRSSSQSYGRRTQGSNSSIHIRSWTQNQIMSQNPEQNREAGQQLRTYSPYASSRLRFWEPAQSQLCLDQLQSESGLPFKLVSYNILAQDLLIEHLQLYSRCNQLHLKWSYRLSKLTEEIVAQRPDILCLQEVQESHLGEIVQNIENVLPLSCVFKKKTGFKSDGCAIFYNKRLFDLVCADVVEYYQPGFDLLDRHNIGVIAKLKCKSKPDVSFLVCTTHLLYNPRRQDVRLAQLIVLLAELDRLSMVEPAESQRLPVILTGDFNFMPDSAPFELITKGKLRYEGLSKSTLTAADERLFVPTGKRLVSPRLGITDNCQHIDCVEGNYKNCVSRLHSSTKILNNSESKPACEPSSEQFSTGTLTHSLNLKSMYNHSGDEAYGSTFQGEWITVDHMFYSEAPRSSPKQGSLQMLSLYKLPLVQECQQIRPLPNADLGSDHLMLASQLYLTFPDGT